MPSDESSAFTAVQPPNFRMAGIMEADVCDLHTLCNYKSRPNGNSNRELPEGVSYDPKNIGKCIADRRRELGLTQEELAAKLGKAPVTLKQMESGERVKSWPVISATAEALQFTPNDLLGFPAASNTMPSADLLAAALKPILYSFGADPEDAQDIALSLLEAVEAARELSDGEPDHQAYSLAGRFAARKSGSQ